MGKEGLNTVEVSYTAGLNFKTTAQGLSSHDAHGARGVDPILSIIQVKHHNYYLLDYSSSQCQWILIPLQSTVYIFSLSIKYL